MRAHVVAVDLGHDLALLRTDAVPEEPFAVPELAETVPAPGTPVWVRGTCVYRHDVSLQGHVARSHTCYEWLPDRGHYVEVFLVAATAPKGMSGAPWIDGDGRVVGLQSGALAVGGSPLALAFAAPGRHLVRLIRERTTARTATIGVPVEELWEQGQDTLERFPPGTEGVVLRQVREDTAAGRAGLQEWDLVRGVDGERVRYRDELLVLVRARLPGETLALDVLGPDGAQPRRVDVELDCLEDAWLERGYP
jgi:S1-C subfamily serine protease